MSSYPNHGRYYANIIRRLVELGFVVHSHFHDIEGRGNQVYRDLGEQLTDYHFHDTISFRKGTRYSETLSRYDLMGIFHEPNATRQNETALVEMSMPTKAVSGWLCGGIPTVCSSHYEGICERVRKYGIGLIADSWDELGRIAHDRASIDSATEACLEHRHRFTTEWNAAKVAKFYQDLLTSSADGAKQ